MDVVGVPSTTGCPATPACAAKAHKSRGLVVPASYSLPRGYGAASVRSWNLGDRPEPAASSFSPRILFFPCFPASRPSAIFPHTSPVSQLAMTYILCVLYTKTHAHAAPLLLLLLGARTHTVTHTAAHIHRRSGCESVLPSTRGTGFPFGAPIGSRKKGRKWRTARAFPRMPFFRPPLLLRPPFTSCFPSPSLHCALFSPSSLNTQ